MIAVALLCIEYYTPGITRNLSKACTREKSLGEMRDDFKLTECATDEETCRY